MLPNELPGLQLWLDATNLGLVDGDPIATWPDLSPNHGDLTQSVAQQRPTFKAAGLSGRPGVFFDPAPVTPMFLSDNAASVALRPASGAMTVFVVAENAPTATYAAYSNLRQEFPAPLVLAVSDLANGMGWQVGGSYDSPQNLVLGAQVNASQDLAPSVATQWQPGVNLLAMTYDGAELRGYRDGTSVGADTWPLGLGSPSDAYRVSVGSRGDGLGGSPTWQFLGTVGEVVVYDRVLSDYERQQVTDYLRAKWQAITPPVRRRTPVDALRSLARYTALALGEEWEVRLSSEKGVFNRPYARVSQVPSFVFVPVRLPVVKVMSSYQIVCFPVPGREADESQLEVLRVVDLLWNAFSGSGVQGLGAPAMRAPVDPHRPYTHRVPLYDYTGVPVSGPTAMVTESNRDPRDFMRVEGLPDVSPFADPADELLFSVAANIRMSWLRSAAVPSNAPATVSVGVGVTP